MIKGYINVGDIMNKQIIYKMFRETIDDVTEVKIRVYKRLLEHWQNVFFWENIGVYKERGDNHVSGKNYVNT